MARWSEPFSRMLRSPMREGLTKKIEIKDEESKHIKQVFGIL